MFLHPRPLARTLGLFVACVMALTVATGYAGRRDLDGSPAAKNASGRAANGYIVQLLENPVVAYDGTIAGLKATKPQKGGKIDPNSPDVTRYAAFLDSRHDALLASVGGARKQYSYRYTFNGFAADLTADQAAKLATTPGVVSVVPNTLSQPDTSTTPTFLGLNAQNGLWSQLSGNADGSPISGSGPNSGGAGEGVVVGIVDSGIWPENPSFSDRDASGKLVFQQIPGWHGKCTPGEAFPVSACNQKLIAAQWFGEGFGGADGIKTSFPYEFISARGAAGHGSHTAATAAGNYGVDAIVDGVNLGKLSGMAPRARIAVYKVCWGAGEGGCATSDSVAAIDQAVADGVDVLNFSISGSRTSFLDPVEIAFLFAADAGVFVAASAGNSGPDASTVAHNSPWITTVAAGTHDRVYNAKITLGNGATYTGVGLGDAVASSPLVLSTDAGLASANTTQVRQCYSGRLDPAKVTGKIVVCDRGGNARTDKSLAVKQAGGVGMILANVRPNSLNADLHYVPTVHVDDVNGAAIKVYAVTPGATAALGKGEGSGIAPDVAAFSSRGPALAGGGDLLKPDIMAPGVDVLAAVSPVEGNGRNFDFYSGTSMSSPHIAGIAALFKQKYPTWSPAAIKSALMTTASQTRNNDTPIGGNPFGFGAGQVTPNAAANPGLVYDSGWVNWLSFLCGSGQLTASYCPSISKDPSNLNYPSIAIGDLAGVQTVTRSVTSVGSKPETYMATATLPGFNVEVTPSEFIIKPGETKSYTVKITRTDATFNVYAFGSLTWNGSLGHAVRSPLVVNPVALAAPLGVSGNGSRINYSVTFGYTGEFSVQARGLVPATVNAGTVAQDPDQVFATSDSAGTIAIPVTIAAGTTFARFELFDADVAAGSDMDLYVYRGTTLVGTSAGGTSAEQVNLVNPVAGNYTVYVHGWSVPSGSSPYKLHTWLLDSTNSNMTVSGPTSATTGATGTISLSFSGLASNTKYLGSVAYSGVAGLPNPTIVRVDVP